MDEGEGVGLPIIQYWHDGVAPSEVQKLIDTVREHNPHRPYMRFDEAGAEELIATHFGEREAKVFRACAVPAMQADYFRYCAVHVLGGVWLDTDCRCVASLDALLPEHGGRLFERPDGCMVNCVFAFGSIRHPLLRFAVELVTANIEHRVTEDIFVASGPFIFNVLVRTNRLRSSRWLFDDAREWVGDAAAAEPDRWESYFSLVEEAIGDGAAVVRAFDTVQLVPLSTMQESVIHKASHLPYKQTDAHWMKFSESVYR